MTSLRLKFRPSTANGKEGTLFFILTHRRATRTIYTEFHIKPNEWNDYSSAVKILGTPERQAQLQLIASKVNWSYKLLKSIIAEKETSCVEVQRRRHHRGIQTIAAIPNVVLLHKGYG